MLLEFKLLEASLVILLSRFFSDRSGFVLGSGTSGSPDYNSLATASVPQREERSLFLVSICFAWEMHLSIVAHILFNAPTIV